MKKQLIITTALLGIASSNVALANENYDKRWYIAPSGSFVWTDEDRQTSRNDYGVNLAVGKAICEHFNVELKTFFNRLEHNQSNTTKTQYQWDMFGATVDTLYFFNRDTISPYAVVGVGLADSRVQGKNAVGLIGEAGLGIAYKINNSFSVRSDIRYRYNNNFNNHLTANNADEYNDGIFSIGAVIPLGREYSKAPVPVAKPVVEKKSTNGIVLKNVNFNVNSANLTQSAKEVLNKVASDLKSDSSGRTIEISGHTSPEGNEEANLVLSQKRAQEVVNYLKYQGVTNKMTAKGYGSGSQISEKFSENRRVELLWK